jgi:hypothetical protein
LRAGDVIWQTAILAALLSASSPAPAEVVWLRNGDRLTGTIVSETARALRLKMPFATILIPKSRIERLLRANGKEEVLNAPAVVALPSPAPPSVPAAHLSLVVTGASFWQAWDHRDAPPDPTLRLEVRIDEETIASWTDARLDPEDLPGAVVNTFAFASGDEAGLSAPGVVLRPPEVQPGRVLLRMAVRGGVGESRHLRIAYQTNEATAESPAWRDVASATSTITLRPDAATIVQLRQGRGRMEFARRKMRGIETFRIELSTD